MNWRPIRGWTRLLHEREMKADSMPERLLIGPGSSPSLDPVYPELSPPLEPCPPWHGSTPGSSRVTRAGWLGSSWRQPAAPSAPASDLGASPFGRRPQPPLSCVLRLNHAFNHSRRKAEVADDAQVPAIRRCFTHGRVRYRTAREEGGAPTLEPVPFVARGEPSPPRVIPGYSSFTSSDAIRASNDGFSEVTVLSGPTIFR